MDSELACCCIALGLAFAPVARALAPAWIIASDAAFASAAPPNLPVIFLALSPDLPAAAAASAALAASATAVPFATSAALCSVVLAVGVGLKEFVPSARARFASTMVPAASLPAGALLWLRYAIALIATTSPPTIHTVLLAIKTSPGIGKTLAK